MGLKKAKIQPLDRKGKPKGKMIEVLFNPGEYTIGKSNQYEKKKILGRETPVLQFVSGNNKTLKMDLFFDTYEQGLDVRKYTDKITNLMEIDDDMLPSFYAPPMVKFIWGKVHFKAVIDDITQRFTMFLDDGTPVRAVLGVSFAECQSLFDPSKQSADRTKKTKEITVKQGDSLSSVAEEFYGSPELWRHIARANKIENPRGLEPGKKIIIPPLEG